MNRIYLSEIEKRILKAASTSPSNENQFGDLPLTEVRKAISRLSDCGLVTAPDTEDAGFFFVVASTKGRAYLKEYPNL